MATWQMTAAAINLKQLQITSLVTLEQKVEANGKYRMREQDKV